eukprot:SAG11_NODE_1041_length_6056_cov_5.902468_1_plen_111_part_10
MLTQIWERGLEVLHSLLLVTGTSFGRPPLSQPVGARSISSPPRFPLCSPPFLQATSAANGVVAGGAGGGSSARCVLRSQPPGRSAAGAAGAAGAAARCGEGERAHHHQAAA